MRFGDTEGVTDQVLVRVELGLEVVERGDDLAAEASYRARRRPRDHRFERSGSLLSS